MVQPITIVFHKSGVETCPNASYGRRISTRSSNYVFFKFDLFIPLSICLAGPRVVFPVSCELHGRLQYRGVQYCDVYDCDAHSFLSSLHCSSIPPNAILASIIISAVLGLIDINAAVLLWKIDKFDFLACVGAFFGVVFVSVEIGLLIAVGISFAKILLQVTRPKTVVLGNIPRTSVYRNVDQYPAATRVPDVLIIRVDSAIYFSNSNYIKERILRWLTEEEENINKDQPRVQYLIVDLSPVTDIDTSGIHALEELLSSLQKKNVELILTNPGQTVLDKLHASEFADRIGEDKIFLTVADAVLTFAPRI